MAPLFLGTSSVLKSVATGLQPTGLAVTGHWPGIAAHSLCSEKQGWQNLNFAEPRADKAGATIGTGSIWTRHHLERRRIHRH